MRCASVMSKEIIYVYCRVDFVMVADVVAEVVGLTSSHLYMNLRLLKA